MRSAVLLLLISVSVVNGQLLMYFLNSLGDMVKDAKVPKEFQGNITSPPLINNHLPMDKPHPRIQQLNSKLSTARIATTVSTNGINSLSEQEPKEEQNIEASQSFESSVTKMQAATNATALTKPVIKSGKYRSFLKNVPRLGFNTD